MYWAFPVLSGQSALNIGFLGIVPIMLVAFIVVATLIKIGGVAHSLGGSIASASGSAMLGGMIGGAIGSGLSGMHLLDRAGKSAGGLYGGVKQGVVDGYQGAKQVMKDVRSVLRRGGE